MASDLERKIISKLSDPEAITEVWDAGIRKELFEDPLYQTVFNFIVEYWQRAKMKEAPTQWVLAQKYPGFVITETAQETIFYLAELLQRRFVVNEMQDMMRDASTDMEADPIPTLQALHARAFKACEAVVPRVTRTNMADTIEADRLEYEYGASYPQGMGVPYGLDLLDLHTGGLMPGELAVIGARAKTGKTMLGLHAVSNAVRQGYRPLVFTLEMSLKEINIRLSAMFSGVSYDRLSHHRLSAEELDRLWTARQELANLGGIQIEAPEKGDRTVASLLSRARQYGANYLFIDQLSRMKAGHKTSGLKEQFASIVEQLKEEISRPSMEIPCVLAAQLRRNDDEITMESFSNATEIEQTADILFGLWRNRDMRNQHAMRLDILGSRRSDLGEYMLTWELSNRTLIEIKRD